MKERMLEINRQNYGRFSTLRCEYNRVLEKTSRLYQICCLTRRKKKGRDFEDFFQACALSSPVILLTGDHVYKSDLTRSRLRLRQQEIWVRDNFAVIARLPMKDYDVKEPNFTFCEGREHSVS